jgi:hypothetical protein
MNDTSEEPKKLLFLKRMRQTILPSKKSDSVVVKAGKDFTFFIFLILSACFSIGIIIAVTVTL